MQQCRSAIEGGPSRCGRREKWRFPFYPACIILAFIYSAALEFVMISQVLVLMLLSGAAADRIVDSRRAYSTCVSGLVRTELAAKTDPAAFDAKLTSSCKTQETAFHSAVVTVDVAAGIKRAVAEENASSEINDFIGSAKERYRDDFAVSNPK